MDPVTLGFAGISLYSAFSGANAAEDKIRAENRALQYKAQLANRQAELMDLRANEIEQQGYRDVNRLTKGVEGLRGANRAASGASGVAVDSGSLAALDNESRVAMAQDAMTLRLNARKAASMERANARELRSQGGMYLDSMGDPNKAFRNTLLTGLSSTASGYITGMRSANQYAWAEQAQLDRELDG